MAEERMRATRIVRKQPQHVQEVKVEICVVGSGAAGVSAAIEAARAGHTVALIDSSPMLGGQAVNSIIGTFAGLVSNGPDPYLFTYGIAEDIIRELGPQRNILLRPLYNTVQYDEVALARWIDRTVRSLGITVILGAVLRGARIEGRRITSVDLATRFGDVRLYANGFIDATGDAALTWHAGLPCREPEEGPIYGTQVAVVEGINEEHYPEFQVLRERMKEKADQYGLERYDGIVVLFPGRGTAVLNTTHVETPLEPIAASEKALEGRDRVDKTFNFLKHEFPLAFGQSRIRTYAFPGIRQTRWIVGRHQLTAEEVRQGTYFSDAIARTAWPIELHNKMNGYLWEPFDVDHVHYIPLGSLTPPDVDNLAAAGRCIDADVVALASVRVMGPCMATGAAAAHALSLAGTGSVHEIDIAQLQQRLHDNLHRRDPFSKIVQNQ